MAKEEYHQVLWSHKCKGALTYDIVGMCVIEKQIMSDFVQGQSLSRTSYAHHFDR